MKLAYVRLLAVAPLLLASSRLHAGVVHFEDILQGDWVMETISSNPFQPSGGSYELRNQPGRITLLGSDANAVDPEGETLLFSTITQVTTLITEVTEGDLGFNWQYETGDAGSYYDPAGFLLCAEGGPFQGSCGYTFLTADLDFFSDPTLPGAPPFPESGRAEVSLSSGDRFGFFVLSIDNQAGAGMLTITANTATETPEPGSVALLAGGLLVMVGASVRNRRRNSPQGYPGVRKGLVGDLQMACCQLQSSSVHACPLGSSVGTSFRSRGFVDPSDSGR